MATYYCKTDGDDTLNGLTIPNAWATIEHAHATMVAGDTLKILDGTWTFYATLIISTNGAAGNYISYEANSPGRNVIFQSNGVGRLMQCVADYVRFEGISFWSDTSVYTGAGVKVDGSDHVEFLDCDIGYSQGHALWMEAASNITVDTCDVHNSTYWEDTGLTMEGISIYNGCSNITIVDCNCYNNSHVGIAIGEVATCLVSGCNCYENESHGISVGVSGATTPLSTGVTIEYCTSHNNGPWHRPGGDRDGQKSGIYMGEGTGDVLVRRCIFYENDGPGVTMLHFVNGPVRLYHCVFYRNLFLETVNWGDLALIYGPAGPSGNAIVYVRNCIFVHDKETSSYSLVRETGFLELTCHHDNWYDETGIESISWLGTDYGTYAAWQGATGQEVGGVLSSSPLFVNPTDDFHLQAASPCIDAGVPLATEPGWYGAGPDIGRYEYVTGGIPVVVVVIAGTTVVPVVTVVVVAT